jgi:ketosteroid isomerase-like protein
MSASLQLPTGEFFQLGYVTSDLERAMAHYRDHQGVESFCVLDNRAVLPPDGSDGPFIRVALAYLGSVMIELIEPEAGSKSIYTHALRADGGICLHHIGYLVDPSVFVSLEGNLVGNGIAVPVIRRGGMALIYADTRSTLGLFSEFVCKSAMVDSFFAQVPRFDGVGRLARSAACQWNSNVELAKKLLTAVGRSDIATLQELMTEDATWWSLGQGKREEGVDRDIFLDGFDQAMGRLFSSPVEFEIVGITANEERVAIEANSLATLANGGTYANLYHFLLEFRAGRVYRVREYTDTAYMNASFLR